TTLFRSLPLALCLSYSVSLICMFSFSCTSPSFFHSYFPPLFLSLSLFLTVNEISSSLLWCSHRVACGKSVCVCVCVCGERSKSECVMQKKKGEKKEDFIF